MMNANSVEQIEGKIEKIAFEICILTENLFFHYFYVH